MSKFHVNPETGNVGRCTAEVRDCPHGGESEHYATETEARQAYESTQSTVPGKKTKRVKKESVLDYDQPLMGSFPVKTDDQQRAFVGKFLAHEKVEEMIRDRAVELSKEESERIEKLKETDEGREQLRKERDSAILQARRNVIQRNVAGGRPSPNHFTVSSTGSIVKNDGRSGKRIFVSKKDAKATLDVFVREMSFHGVSKNESKKIFGRWV